jgi:uncharacterized protein (DUF2147 family)
MKKVAFGIFFYCVTISAQAQSIVGKWKTIDDNSGEARSIIEVYERSGKIFGKVASIYFKPGEDTNPVCDKCERTDPRFKKKIIGMEIIQHMVNTGSEYSEGHILDPENGKVYRCKLWLEGKILKVRGYWGPFYRTQTWHQTE